MTILVSLLRALWFMYTIINIFCDYLVKVEWISKLNYSLSWCPSLPTASGEELKRRWYDTQGFCNVKTCEYYFLDLDRPPRSYDFIRDMGKVSAYEVLKRWKITTVFFYQGRTTETEMLILNSFSHNGTLFSLS